MMAEIEAKAFMTAQDLQNRTIQYNAAHDVYNCFSDDEAAKTIIDMMTNNGLLEEEEEPDELR